jgi:hypothetical protein
MQKWQRRSFPNRLFMVNAEKQRVQWDWGGWPGLQTAEATTAADAPSFACFAKSLP